MGEYIESSGGSCDQKPASPTPGRTWFRTGTKNRRVIYMVIPGYPDGIMVGSMDTEELARKAVEGLNMCWVGGDGV